MSYASMFLTEIILSNLSNNGGNIMIKLNVNVNLEVLFDEETNSCNITNQVVQVQIPSNIPLKMEHILGVAEKRYGIFTLGSKSIIGKMLPRDTDIKVIFEGKTYSAHTHKTSGGRIDRLSALLNLEYIHVNTRLMYEYDAEKKELYVSLPE